MKMKELGETLWVVAFKIFFDCGAEGDFCIQHNGGDFVVFGGTNRLVLSRRGFLPDRNYCTKDFLTKWDEKFGGYRE